MPKYVIYDMKNHQGLGIHDYDSPCHLGEMLMLRVEGSAIPQAYRIQQLMHGIHDRMIDLYVEPLGNATDVHLQLSGQPRP